MCAALDLKKFASMCVPFHCIASKYFQNLSVDTSLDYKLDIKKLSNGSHTNGNELALMIMPGFGSSHPVTSLTNQRVQQNPHMVRPSMIQSTYGFNPYDIGTTSSSYHNQPSNMPSATITSCQTQGPTYMASSHQPLEYYSDSMASRPVSCRDKQCPTSRRSAAYCTRSSTATLASLDRLQSLTQEPNTPASVLSMDRYRNVQQQQLAAHTLNQSQPLSQNNCIDPISNIQRVNPMHLVNNTMLHSQSRTVNPQTASHSNVGSHAQPHGLSSQIVNCATNPPQRPQLRRSRRSNRVSQPVPPVAVIDLTQDSPKTHATVHHHPNLLALRDSCGVGNETATVDPKPIRHQPFTSVSEVHHAQQAPASFLQPQLQFSESAVQAGLTPQIAGHTQNNLHIQSTPCNNGLRRLNHLMPSLESCVPCGSSGVPTSAVKRASEHSTGFHNSAFVATSANNTALLTNANLQPYTRWCTDSFTQMSIPPIERQHSTVYHQSDAPGPTQTQGQLVYSYNTRKRSRESNAHSSTPEAKKLCALQSGENIANVNTHFVKTASHQSVAECADKLTTSLNEKSILTSPENFDSFLNLYLFSTGESAATAEVAPSHTVDSKGIDPDLNGCNSKRLIRDNTSLSRSVQARAS